MSYEAAPNVDLKPLTLEQQGQEPESFTPGAVFLLDTGDLVAVHYSAKRTPANTLSCRALAWLVDADGDAQATVDAAGKAIVVDFKHNAPAQQLSALTANGLAATLRDLVLGEPPADPENPPIRWSQELRDEVNIRYAIATARATGETIDLVTTPVPVMDPIP